MWRRHHNLRELLPYTQGSHDEDVRSYSSFFVPSACFPTKLDRISDLARSCTTSKLFLLDILLREEVVPIPHLKEEVLEEKHLNSLRHILRDLVIVQHTTGFAATLAKVLLTKSARPHLCSARSPCRQLGSLQVFLVHLCPPICKTADECPVEDRAPLPPRAF